MRQLEGLQQQVAELRELLRTVMAENRRLQARLDAANGNPTSSSTALRPATPPGPADLDPSAARTAGEVLMDQDEQSAAVVAQKRGKDSIVTSPEKPPKRSVSAGAGRHV